MQPDSREPTGSELAGINLDLSISPDFLAVITMAQARGLRHTLTNSIFFFPFSGHRIEGINMKSRS